MIGALFGLATSLIISEPSHARQIAQTVLAPLPQAGDVVRPQPPVKKDPNDVGVRTTSASAFVADIATGKVLYAKDPHHVQPIASLTKLMTAMVFLDQKIDLQSKMVFAEQDFDGADRPVFHPGDAITYEQALRAMLIGSVNEAADAIARTSMGQQKFVQAMNDKAHALGLSSPHFADPSGVDPRNQADAADVAAMLSDAVGYPEIREIAHLSSVDIKTSSDDLHITSTNLLLPTYLNKKPFTIIAAKTGSLPEAGYCMAQVTQNGDGHEIIAVELGSDNHFSRYQDIKALTTWAFDAYQWK